MRRVLSLGLYSYVTFGAPPNRDSYILLHLIPSDLWPEIHRHRWKDAVTDVVARCIPGVRGIGLPRVHRKHCSKFYI